jgi:hypothetical protein
MIRVKATLELILSNTYSQYELTNYLKNFFIFALFVNIIRNKKEIHVIKKMIKHSTLMRIHVATLKCVQVIRVKTKSLKD